MIRTLIQALTVPRVTSLALLADLPDYARGLPTVTAQPCAVADGCNACVESCPTSVIAVLPDGTVTVDRGGCLVCGLCTEVCPTGTLALDRTTKVAARTRAELIRTNRPAPALARPKPPRSPFRHSLHFREVATGDNASDTEVATIFNPIFDAARFGIHVVASPRHADALVVTGPVGRAMQSPLLRCYEAMAEPRLVVAVGAAAISGGLHAGGYATANGVDAVLPVDMYVPGNPPHPWMILHGLLLAMGHPAAR